MSEERIILEINPRTKEKKLVKVTDLQLIEGYTIANLLDDLNHVKTKLARQELLNAKLIDVISNLNKSTTVQIADIKGDLK
jgi:hypothetical protein